MNASGLLFFFFASFCCYLIYLYLISLLKRTKWYKELVSLTRYLYFQLMHAIMQPLYIYFDCTDISKNIHFPPKNCIAPLCFNLSHVCFVGCQAASSDTFLNWRRPSLFKFVLIVSGEDFGKRLQKLTKRGLILRTTTPHRVSWQ